MNDPYIQYVNDNCDCALKIMEWFKFKSRRLNVAWDNGPRYASTKKMPNKGTFRELLK